MPDKTLRILYFAWLRERVGAAEEELAPPPGTDTVGDLISWLKTRDAGHKAAFENEKLVRCAVDQEFATADVAIAGAREIAFFPPVTGG